MAVKTMNVSIGEELVSYVESKVGTGFYTNNSEVVREALREHMERREARTRAMEQLTGDLAVGMGDLKAGRVVSAEEAIRRAQAIIGEVAGD
jgi:putative addiction module CopG family antidote